MSHLIWSGVGAIFFGSCFSKALKINYFSAKPMLLSFDDGFERDCKKLKPKLLLSF